ncbi:hypothetical protein [Andreprevotia chitinilytica]|uniref:hypothetical protein n=1 Tax=Andreprevotia chitinilytica TaxID=396808 RepID=UPI00054F7767|nr:hypothetical protein [Andreprevotia chitinilytica]
MSFCIEFPLQKAAPIESAKRAARALKLMFWTCWVKCALRCSSANQLARRLNSAILGMPEASEAAWKKKWQNYQAGRRSPQHALVAAVARVVPGSADILSHPLWDILGGDRITPTLQRRVYQALPPETRSRILQRCGSPFAGRLGLRLLQQLERRAGLGVLAYLVVQLQNTSACGEAEQAHAISRSIMICLLILCVDEPYRAMAGLLYRYFLARVYPLVAGFNAGEFYDPDGFIACVRILRKEYEARAASRPPANSKTRRTRQAGLHSLLYATNNMRVQACVMPEFFFPRQIAERILLIR